MIYRISNHGVLCEDDDDQRTTIPQLLFSVKGQKLLKNYQQQQQRWWHPNIRDNSINRSRIHLVHSGRWRMTLLSRLFIVWVVMATCGPIHHRRNPIFLPMGVVLVVHAGWIDPDTPEQFHTTQPLTKGDQREFQLVCSLQTVQMRNCTNGFLFQRKKQKVSLIISLLFTSKYA